MGRTQWIPGVTPPLAIPQQLRSRWWQNWKTPNWAAATRLPKEIRTTTWYGRPMKLEKNKAHPKRMMCSIISKNKCHIARNVDWRILWIYIYIVYVPIRPVRSLSDPVLLSNYIIYNYVLYIKVCVCVWFFFKPSLTVPIGSAFSATHSKTYACASLYTKIWRIIRIPVGKH